MKILFLDWSCFMKEPTFRAFKNMGHEYFLFSHKDFNELKSDDFLKVFFEFTDSKSPDICFSYNYYPLLAEGCKEKNIPYVSLVYDSPYTYLYSYTVMYPTNYIFLFDRSWVEEFRQGGLLNVHYSVLPGDANAIDSLLSGGFKQDRVEADISFVGNLYNEKHNFYERFEDKLTPYLKGYLEGMMEAQQKLYGVSIVEPMLTDDIVKSLYDIFPIDENPLLVEPSEYRYSEYVIKRKITQLERIAMLSLIGNKAKEENYNAKLYTVNPDTRISGFKNMGVAPYDTEMPLVFNQSKININITLRSIKNGIPLRCIDIMSAGGFLLSNYQEDLCIDFVPGEEFDFYGDREEMLQKIEYYLSHEKERQEIAENARERIKRDYSFENIFTRMFELALSEDHV